MGWCALSVTRPEEQADPSRWFNTRERYVKAMKHYRPGLDSDRALTAAGYSAEQLNILRDGMALDFFHVAPRDEPLPPDLTRFIEDTIRNRRFIEASDEAKLSQAKGNVSLTDWRPGQFCLRFEAARDVNGLIYAVTYKVFRHLRGNIFGLTAQAARDRAYVTVYHSLPPGLSLEQAQAIAAEHF